MFLILLGPAAVGHAEPSPEQLARQYFQEGKRLFLAESYTHALEAFRQAYGRRPLPDILFMIGQCQRNLGRHAEAVRSFKGYLAGKPEAEDRQQVAALIARLEEKAAHAPSSSPVPPPPLPAPENTHPEDPPAKTAPDEVKVLMQPPPPAPAVRPLQKRWWFWAAVGGAVATALGVGIAVGYAARGPGTPAGSIGTLDLRMATW